MDTGSPRRQLSEYSTRHLSRIIFRRFLSWKKLGNQKNLILAHESHYSSLHTQRFLLLTFAFWEAVLVLRAEKSLPELTVQRQK